MIKRIATVGLLAASSLLSTAYAGLVQLEFNHSTSIGQQNYYNDILSELTFTQTNPADYYGDGFGYNDFRFDFRFSDFNYRFDEGYGELRHDGLFNVSTVFSVGLDNADNQSRLLATINNAQFNDHGVGAILNQRLPDDSVSSIFDFYDREITVTSDSDKNLDDVAAKASPTGSHLALDINGSIDSGYIFDANMFFNWFSMAPFDDIFKNTYNGWDSALVDPTQDEIDQYVAENFISAIDWSFTFTRSTDGTDPDELGYNVDANINFEYAQSAEDNVRGLFDDHLSHRIRALDYIPEITAHLTTASSTVEFVNAEQSAVSVSEPNSAIIALSGLLGLMFWRRRNR